MCGDRQGDAMGDAMSESETQIEQMQRQLELMAAREQMLMTALNEALEEADRKLLDDVRSIALEHEARRRWKLVLFLFST